MLNLKKIFLALFLVIINIQVSVADLSCISDDSLNNTITKDLDTLGEYSLFINNFSMTDAMAEGEVPASSATTYSNGTPISLDHDGHVKRSCDVASTTKKVKFCYNPTYSTSNSFAAADCIVGSASDVYKDLNGARFRVIDAVSKLCVQVLGSAGWATMGCKASFDAVAASGGGLSYASCMVADSCLSVPNNSQTFFPITSTIITCVKDSVTKNLFNATASCAKSNLLPAMQNALRKAVMAALILYVILFGIRIIMGGNPPNQGEAFIFILKIALVIYFSVGFSIGNGQYSDGLTTMILPAAQAISAELASMLFASGGAGLCYFDLTQYPVDSQYMALWDAVDCRMAYYFGFVNPLRVMNTMALDKSYLFIILWPAIFSFQFIIIIFSLLLFIFFTSIIIYFVSSYMVATIAIGIVVFLGPLFVPMALFKFTKGYFDAWCRMLLSFTLQPMVICAFLALVVTILDSAMYGTCTWNSNFVSAANSVSGLKAFYISNLTDPACTNSWGYAMGQLMNSNNIYEISAIFFTLPVLMPVSVNMITCIIKVSFFAILFYFFADTVDSLAADITGGPSVSDAGISPTALIDKFASAIGRTRDGMRGMKHKAQQKKLADKSGKDRGGIQVLSNKSGSSSISGVKAVTNKSDVGSTTKGKI